MRGDISTPRIGRFGSLKRSKCSTCTGKDCTVLLQYTKGSDLKVLKTKDVEDADGFEVFLPFNLLIDLKYDPGETLGIQCHGNRIS